MADPRRGAKEGSEYGSPVFAVRENRVRGSSSAVPSSGFASSPEKVHNLPRGTAAPRVIVRPGVFVRVPSIDESLVLGEETPAALAFPVVVAATSNSSLVKRTVVLSRVRLRVRRRARWAPGVVDGGLRSRAQHGTGQVAGNGRRPSSPLVGIRRLLLDRVGILLLVLVV